MWVRIFAILSLIIALALPTAAEDMGVADIEKEFSQMMTAIPDDVARLLPDSFFDGTVRAAEGLDDTLNAGFWWEAFCRQLNYGMRDMAPVFLSIMAVLIVSALISAFKDVFHSEALSNAVGLAVSVVLVTMVVRFAVGHIEAVKEYFDRLYEVCLAMLPVMGAVLATGGSGMAAVATHGGFLAVLGVLEFFVGQSFGKIAGISLALNAASSLNVRFRLSAIGRAVRRCFGIFFGVVTSCLGFIISLKIGIAAAGDSMAMRGAKLFASNAIPIVGSAVGDSLKTLVTALSYIKSVSGAVGIVIILLLVLPVLINVWLFRVGLVLLSAVAEMLGCEKERELLSGVVSVYGYMLAVIAVTAVIFIIMMTLFSKTALAFGG